MQCHELFSFDLIKYFNTAPIKTQLATDFYDECIQNKDVKDPA